MEWKDEDIVPNIVAEIKDVTDPSSIEIINCYLDELRVKDEIFLELLEERLKDVCVHWNHPWYQDIDTQALSVMSKSEQGMEEFRRDKFTSEERELMLKNWQKFIKKYDLPDHLVSVVRWVDGLQPTYRREKRFVCAYLGRGLKRCIRQLYRFIAIDLTVRKKNSNYTKEEELILETIFFHKPKKCINILTNILGREPRALLKRLAIARYGGIEKRPKLKWTLPLATKFVKGLMEVTGLPLKKLKYHNFDKTVWLKLEEQIGQHYMYLRQSWYCYIHVQLFAKYDIKLNKLRRKIFKHLKSSNYKVWSDIQWKNVLEDGFKVGFTHIFLYRACITAVNNHENYLRTPLQDLIEFSLKRMKNHRYRYKRLKNLAFDSEGNLETVRYDRKF